MGTLFSALYLGRAGLQVAQVQLDVAGHNIASVNKEGFSRQRALLTTRVPNLTTYGVLGRGPTIKSIQRIRDPLLDLVYRTQASSLGSAEVVSAFYSQVEDVFLEPAEGGLSDRLSVFFDALGDFSTGVEELPVRVSTLAECEALASGLNQVAQRLTVLRTNANEEVYSLVAEINSITEQVAELNTAIRKMELVGDTASDLRDDRDVLLDELSSLLRVTVREQEDGQVTVLVGGDELISSAGVRELEAFRDATIDPSRSDLYGVRFTSSGRPLTIDGGQLDGTLYMRDVAIPEVQDQLDQMAAAIIESANQIQSQGRGFTAIGAAIDSTNAVSGAGTALNSADLPFTLTDGSFDIVVYDGTGAIAETVTVNITATGPLAGQTTLIDVETAINTGTNISATVNADGTLTITPAAGYSFMFSNDTANALPALGLNGLFTGDSAATIAVSQHLLDDPSLLSSSYSQDLLNTGDNEAALALAGLRSATILAGGEQTVDDFYEATIVQIGIDARANEEELDVAAAFVDDADQRRLENSGVNLDEEVTSLVLFQRAYEASARVITVTDRMLDALMGLVG